MYRSYDDVNGMPPRIYRSSEEIKRDIRGVSERISEINEMLNIRELLSEFVFEQSDLSTPKLQDKLSELLSYALEALDELRELSNTLDELKAELIESVNLFK